MDIHYLKSEFLNVKDFFYFLYSHNSRQNSARISSASDKELDILIKFLHLISNGKIILKKQNLEAVLKSRRMKTLRCHFERKDSFLETLNSERDNKIDILKKFVVLYPSLFFTTFNLI